ncbi:LysR family transcriptional regulator [Plastorhodobacter daqingensis]|uniref:LysR family transcriptional regulator n=1 Tax=Plastorhodobacter daqingensis TaxID=1387281 RepID=A0ABW2UL14_9RHOB
MTARLVLALARDGSIARTAQAERIAPSAVSRRIAELEGRLGVVLFDRSAQGVRLTAAGDTYAETARMILQQIEDLDVLMSSFSAGRAGRLRLACTSSALSGILPERLALFARTYPGVTLDIREMYGTAALSALSDAEVDLAVLTDNHDFSPYEVLPVSSDDVWVIASPDHPLAARLAGGRPIPFADVVGHEMVGFHHSGALDRLLSEAAARAGQSMGERVNVETMSSLVRMVEAGFGIGFLRGTGLHLLGGTDVLGAPLAEDWARRNMVVAMRKMPFRSHAVTNFLGLLRDRPAQGPAEGAARTPI